jgi:ABC-type cobalt transport system substrate-binding protein
MLVMMVMMKVVVMMMMVIMVNTRCGVFADADGSDDGCSVYL